jgi:S-(hydroxymethyl)glutathione dehydrogenase/alcohol dehydrogenase
MKAAVFHGPDLPLTIEDVEIEKPAPREVLIRTAVAGLCHSDLHFMEGKWPWPAPAVLGHESSGIVEAVGRDVTYVKPGDHVITCLSVFCGYCENCLSGRMSICQNTEVKLMPGVAKRLRWQGKHLNQYLNLSSFAEQMLVHEHALVKVTPDMPLDLAALIGCGVMTGFGAVVHTAKVQPAPGGGGGLRGSGCRRSMARPSPVPDASSPSTGTRASWNWPRSSVRPTACWPMPTPSRT